MSFWDIVWFILISFALVAYLMVMFAIITDLFRDPKASGIAKAAWFIALIVFPFLTSVMYLVTRGKGMGERQARGVEQLRKQEEAYIRNIVGPTGPSGEIVQAKSMLDSGAITVAEFERLKEKALA